MCQARWYLFAHAKSENFYGICFLSLKTLLFSGVRLMFIFKCKELLKADQLWQQTYSSQLVLTEVGNMLRESIIHIKYTRSNLGKTSSKVVGKKTCIFWRFLLWAENFTSLWRKFWLGKNPQQIAIIMISAHLKSCLLGFRLNYSIKS